MIAAIRDEAVAEAERIERDAAAEVATLRDVEPYVVADREQRLAVARREARERVAQEEWQYRRAVIEQREQWIQRVVARGRELLATKDVKPLIDDAKAHLPGGECEIVDAAGGGVIVSVGDIAFDNSIDARSRRLEPEWRKAVSALYEVKL